MFCISCGKKLLPEAQFCKFCGTAILKEPKKKLKGKFFIIIPTLIFLIVAVTSGVMYVSSAKSLPKKTVAAVLPAQTKRIVSPPKCNLENTTNIVEQCTVKVSTNLKQGTGISIGNNYVLTNKHVIASSQSISVIDSNKVQHKVQLWNYSQNSDIAILKVTDLPYSCELTTTTSSKGDKVRALGFPQDLQDNSDPVLTEGVISKFLTNENGDQLIRIDATINPGNSGGPLFNECGIIGINTLKIVTEGVENAGYAIANSTLLDQIQPLINSGGTATVPVSSTNDISQPTPEENTSDIYSSSDIEKVKNIKSIIDKKRAAWNSYTFDDFDHKKVDQIKDLISRMANVTDNILPKIIKGQQLNDEEGNLFKNLVDMFNTLVAYESQLGITSDQNYDYYYAKCSNQACVKSSGIGKNTCTSDYDCVPKYHTECRNMACVQVEGLAINQCLSNNDCFHYTCDSGACKQVPGKGIDQCYADIYCKHTECQNNKCTIVNTPGTSACNSDDMCK